MKASFKWLKELACIPVSPHQFGLDITMSGSKVESLYCPGDEIENVVIGKLISVEQHPNADKLLVCQVDVGQTEPIQICTGADNIFAGAVVPVALSGAKLPGGVKIKKGNLRGMESNGMLCSLSELNLTVNDFPDMIEDGIMIINEPCEPGQDACAVLGLDDTCVEFEITSNRPDCLTVSGLAREAAATYGLPLNPHEPVVKGSGDDIINYIDVEVEDTAGCTRYVARAVKNIKIEPSPLWLRERLRMCGVRPINNLVDITNYVMLEYHPMHAFDLRYIEDNKLIIRRAEQDESIVTLDSVKRGLDSEMLMICDGKKPVAIAGIMGGEYSGVTDDTSTVIFEAACFDGPMVRAASKKLGLRTESSTRFEKGLDSEICYTAVMRACELVEMLGAGEVVDGIIDVYNDQKEVFDIDFDAKWINGYLGTQIPAQDMERMLTLLDIEIKDGKLIIPSVRKDLQTKYDISEEIARLYGYNNIPTTALRGTAEASLTPWQTALRMTNQVVSANGCCEVKTYSFISPKSYDKINMAGEDHRRQSVVIRNPLGEDTSVMRTTMIPSMLEVISHNYNNRTLKGRFYEIGKEYIPADGDELPLEISKLIIGIYGEEDFYSLKGIIEPVLDAFNLSDAKYTADSNATFHPHRYADIIVGDKIVGFLGEIHPLTAKKYNIGAQCLIAQLNLEDLFALKPGFKQYTPLPKYPSINRDITVICDEKAEGGALSEAISKAVGRILDKVTFLYAYQGEQIPQGKKSMSYNITMRSKTATLTDEEADKAMEKTFKVLAAMGAELR